MKPWVYRALFITLCLSVLAISSYAEYLNGDERDWRRDIEDRLLRLEVQLEKP